MKYKLCLILCLAGSLLFAQVAEKGKYDELARKVEESIKKDKKIRIEGLQVLDANGTVYLEGVAELLGGRIRAEKIASETDGVIKVDNQIAVKSGDVQDGEIQAELVNKIQRRLIRGPFDLVSVHVNHGFVTLLGVVRDTTIKDKAYEDAIWIRGVREVTNKISFASISAGDERLRRAIYNLLSREYPRYFLGTVPSIVIIVDNARVALIGSVSSPVERDKIGVTIRTLPGVLSLDNRLETH
jgi:osmotically-inducible protein OsmY